MTVLNSLLNIFFLSVELICILRLCNENEKLNKKYNDLRVQYASLKSKRGVEDENN